MSDGISEGGEVSELADVAHLRCSGGRLLMTSPVFAIREVR